MSRAACLRKALAAALLLGAGCRTDAPPANSIGLTFVRIPAGSFLLGTDAPEADADERPAHRVTLTRPFWLSTTEVTQAQWRAVMGSNPSRFQGENLPVECVSWDDAQAFLARLNAREGTTRYRLPTEAEWEWACRAGGPVTDRTGDVAASGWFNPNSGGTPHPVARKAPNARGLHDMLGNVAEWCQDWKGAYPSGAVTDPVATKPGWGRVARGGSWFAHANRARSHFRDAYNPGYRFPDTGLRVAADPIGR